MTTTPLEHPPVTAHARVGESAHPASPGRVLIAHPSADTYGADLQLLQTVSALTSRGWAVTVAIPAHGPLTPMLRAQGATVRLVDFPVLRRSAASGRGAASLLAAASKAMPRLRRCIRDIAPDVVYANTVTIPWWLAAARLTGTPALCHVHESEAEDRRLIRTALNAPLLAADSIIAISRPARDTLVSAVPMLRRRIRLIYNGVPGPDAPVTPREGAGFHVVVVGRLSPRKGAHLALEAVAASRRAGHDVTIELCGTAFEGYEWYVDQLRQRADADDLRSCVTFSGYCSPIWTALQRADALIAPSSREPFGNAVVEAQHAGRPVVAAAAAGHLETVADEQTGLLVPPDDAAAMAAAIGRLASDPSLRHRLASHAETIAQQRFSVTRYAEDVIETIESLRSSRRGARRERSCA